VLAWAALALIPVLVVVRDVDREDQVLHDAGQVSGHDRLLEVFAEDTLEHRHESNLKQEQSTEDCQGLAKADDGPLGEVRRVFLQLSRTRS